MGRGIALSLVLLLSGCALTHPPKPFRDEVPISRPIAYLEQSQTAQVLFLNSKTPKPSQAGTPLRAGEVVTTDRQGTAQIHFPRHSRSRLARQTEIEIQSPRSLKLRQGSLIVSSREVFQVNTRFGRVSATNAVFYLETSSNPWYSSQIVVLQGKVESFILDSEGKVLLKAGEAVTITPWGIPWKVRVLEAADRQKWVAKVKQLFKFTDRLPLEVDFSVPLPTPKPKPRPSLPTPPSDSYYAPPLPPTDPPPYYDYAPPRPVVRAAPPPPPEPHRSTELPPPPPPPVVYEPPPPEPEVIPVQTPAEPEPPPLEVPETTEDVE